MRAIMVQGTSSGSGKSLIATALCRHFANLGVKVAPFKAQNMSNNARVVAGGGEIGVAQYLQALAARARPDVRMNPILVKPESNTSSQVVVNGIVDHELSSLPWRQRAPRQWQAARAALASLSDEYELLVLEGAGSPAEINLRSTDLANMRSAREAGAPVILVTDIDRGGAFAHLYGTWALLESEDRARLAGFVLNKFRGDATLLAPAPEQISELTGMAALGVVGWLEHGLPDEDGASPFATVRDPEVTSAAGRPAAATIAGATPAPPRPTVAIVRYPLASNLDEYKSLERAANLVWARSPAELDGADLVILPGSKHTTADLDWLHDRGLADAIVARARNGGRVLGICGGLQMLGRRLTADADTVEQDRDGLGLLDVETHFSAEKLTWTGEAHFTNTIGEPWSNLAGLAFHGYEIRQGRTTAIEGVESTAQALTNDQPGWYRGPVLGIAVHGLFEDESARTALLGGPPAGEPLDATLEQLAQDVMADLDARAIEALAGC